MPISVPFSANEEHEESFFVSMTDMMVGIIFLFIIMLMFFAMKFSDDSVDLRVKLDLFEEAWKIRKAMIGEIHKSLEQQGVKVSIDDAHGILRLPEDILFAVNRAELSADGRDAVGKLAHALAKTLPCYTTQEGENRPADCPSTAFGLEALLIEGHTDTDGSEEINWHLSMERALHTYQVLVKECPELALMHSPQRQGLGEGYPLLSVAGYGFNRPIAPNITIEGKKQNRRIDIRFLMTPPDQTEIEAARQLQSRFDERIRQQ
jgi:outer membrane protein OmpA-like peptidoglycan-associated protein